MAENKGKDLIESLVMYSGLPENYTRNRLHEMMQKRGINPDTVTLDEIRELAAGLLQDIILSTNQEA